MNSKGRIGLIIPEINGVFDYDFIDGTFAQAKELGFDLIIYTAVTASRENSNSYISGSENIYTLVCTNKLDGIIFAAERFKSDDTINKIFDCLSQTDTPTVVLGMERNGFNSIYSDESEGIYKITLHLIEEHGCQKLYCLTDSPDCKYSIIDGFKKACSDMGIQTDKNNIFYNSIQKNIASDIAGGRLSRPDAIVCTNDIIADSLVRTLRENGVRVPEDIAVTGYGGNWESMALTTVQGRDRQFGADAVCKLFEIITNERYENNKINQSLRLGSSCGCTMKKISENNLNDMILEKYISQMMKKDIQGLSYRPVGFINNISRISSLEDLREQADNMSYNWKHSQSLDICLCEDWQINVNNPDDFRQYGYPENMYLLLSKNKNGKQDDSYNFSTSDIIPRLCVDHEPCIAIVAPLHCDGQILGYAVSTHNQNEYMISGGSYVVWNDALSYGLKNLQKKLYDEYINKQNEKNSFTDLTTGMLNQRGFTAFSSEYLENNNSKNYFIFITYYSDKIPLENKEHIIANIIADKCCYDDLICARISSDIFGIIYTLKNNVDLNNIAVKLSDSIKNYLQERLKNMLFISEVIIHIAEINSSVKTEIQAVINESILLLSDKKKKMKYNSISYKNQMFDLRKDIISNPQKNWTASQIAKNMHISKSHLQRLYKQLFSVALKDDIINARINRAEQMLRHTDMRIREIALQCGYNSETHFMRQFKEKTNITASDYRKQNR